MDYDARDSARLRIGEGFYQQRGFVLTEVMVAIIIVGIAILPMVQALVPVFGPSDYTARTVVMSAGAEGTLNRITDLDYSTVHANQGKPVDLVALFGTAQEAAKEDVVYQGQTYSPQVVIYDASGGSGGLLEIFVTLDEVTFQTLKTEW